VSDDLDVRAGVVIPASELSWNAVRSGGPGGQNVNKVSTKIELRFALSRSRALAEPVKARLRALAASRLDGSGDLLLTADETRSQSQNLEIAREKLAALVRAALIVPKRRRPTKPSAGAKKRRMDHKRRVGEKKRGRRAGWDRE
jgi:ribosome-associated protein